MDFVAHYRRAVELADLADQAIGQPGDDALRRAEVLALMCQARGQLAWVAYMGVDAIAAQRLAEDVRDAPDEDALPAVITRLQDPARRAARTRVHPRGAS